MAEKTFQLRMNCRNKENYNKFILHKENDDEINKLNLEINMFFPVQSSRFPQFLFTRLLTSDSEQETGCISISYQQWQSSFA